MICSRVLMMGADYWMLLRVKCCLLLIFDHLITSAADGCRLLNAADCWLLLLTADSWLLTVVNCWLLTHDCWQLLIAADCWLLIVVDWCWVLLLSRQEWSQNTPLCQNPTPAHLSAARGTKANCAKLLQSRWLFLIDENIQRYPKSTGVGPRQQFLGCGGGA